MLINFVLEIFISIKFSVLCGLFYCPEWFNFVRENKGSFLSLSTLEYIYIYNESGIARWTGTLNIGEAGIALHWLFLLIIISRREDHLCDVRIFLCDCPGQRIE